MADFAQYLSTIADLRQQLLALNKATVGDAINLVENAALSKFWSSQEKKLKQDNDKKIADYYSNLKNIGNNYLIANTAEPNSSVEKRLNGLAGEERTVLKVDSGSLSSKQGNIDKEVFDYYQKDVATKQGQLIQAQSVPVPNTPEVGDTMYPFTVQQSALTIPSYVVDIHSVNSTTDKAVDKYGGWRENIPSYVNRKDEALPNPGEDVPGHEVDNSFLEKNTWSSPAYGSKGQPQKIYKSWIGNNSFNGPYSPAHPRTDDLDKQIEALNGDPDMPGAYKFFIEKLHGRSVTGAFYKKNPVKSSKLTTDGRPDNLRNRWIFPAYIDAFNDSYDLDWQDYSFLGRGEKVYTYQSTTRSLTLSFWMMSDYSLEILTAAVDAADNSKGKQVNTLEDKLGNTTHSPSSEESQKLKEIQRMLPDWGLGVYPTNTTTPAGKYGSVVPGQISYNPESLYVATTFLAQCAYPWYRKDGKMKEQPFIRVRIGDFFDVIAKINSLVFTQDEFDMDLNPSSLGVIPMAIKVALTMTVIHNEEPSSDYGQFYHRKEYDQTNEKPSTLKESGGQEECTKGGRKPQSALVDIHPSGNKKSVLDFPTDALLLQEAASEFSKELKSLSGSKVNLNDFLKRDKLKKALQTGQKLINIKNQMQVVGMLKDTSIGNVISEIEKGQTTIEKAKQEANQAIQLGNSLKGKSLKDIPSLAGNLKTSFSSTIITNIFKKTGSS
jgi:hypothetical protein